MSTISRPNQPSSLRGGCVIHDTPVFLVLTSITLYAAVIALPAVFTRLAVLNPSAAKNSFGWSWMLCCGSRECSINVFV